MTTLKCLDCVAPAHGKDGLCKSCRVRRMGVARLKYGFTPELDLQLTMAYRTHRNRKEQANAIKEMVRRTRYPKWAFMNRAVHLGLRAKVSNFWKPEEVRYLEEFAGEVSVRTMSDKLGRPSSAIQAKIIAMGMSSAVTSGFSVHQLTKLFGVHGRRINEWIGKGFLTYDEQEKHVAYAEVERFCWVHMSEYRFASCQEWWLKTMLKPTTGKIDARRKEAA